MDAWCYNDQASKWAVRPKPKTIETQDMGHSTKLELLLIQNLEGLGSRPHVCMCACVCVCFVEKFRNVISFFVRWRQKSWTCLTEHLTFLSKDNDHVWWSCLTKCVFPFHRLEPVKSSPAHHSRKLPQSGLLDWWFFIYLFIYLFIHFIFPKTICHFLRKLWNFFFPSVKSTNFTIFFISRNWKRPKIFFYFKIF
jgi:hypothetical protein